MNNIFITFVFVMIAIHSSSSLLCYYCTEQSDLEGQCLNAFKKCENNEDKCLTEFHWGRAESWYFSSNWEYFVTKSCSTNDTCAAKHTCTQLSHTGWKCIDCCSGDLCNDHANLRDRHPKFQEQEKEISDHPYM